MVKYVFFAALLAGACTQPHQERTCDTQEFELDQYSERVRSFLESRAETRDREDYLALFVNTENCPACMRSAFESVGPFLSGVKTPTFIYINDSSLLNLAPENRHMHFVWLPVEDYYRQNIPHGRMYLYEVHGQRLRTLDLPLPQIDQ